MKYTIEQVAAQMDAHRYGTYESSVAFLLTDSRSLCFPEETLFFALRSERNDGHRYIEELYKRGVRNFVVEALPPLTSPLHGEDGRWLANFLVVDDVRRALQRLAECHRKAFHVPVIGITGSNGKQW